LDVASAKASGWRLKAGVLNDIEPLAVPDVPDNRNQIPHEFRLAYFYPDETIARYTNDVDFQAMIVFSGPATSRGLATI
jgi:hypothetical protein